MQGQSDRTLPAAEALPEKKRRWDHRVFFRYEDRRRKADDPDRTDEFYSDFRKARLFFDPLLFKAV